MNLFFSVCALTCVNIVRLLSNSYLFLVFITACSVLKSNFFDPYRTLKKISVALRFMKKNHCSIFHFLLYLFLTQNFFLYCYFLRAVFCLHTFVKFVRFVNFLKITNNFVRYQLLSCMFLLNNIGGISTKAVMPKKWLGVSY